MLVILAIAVIILIAIVAVFMGVWSPFATNQQGRANFNKACQIMVNTGCAGDPSADLCKETCDDDMDKLAVKVGCGCPGVAPSGGGAGGGASLKGAGVGCNVGTECTSGTCSDTAGTPPLGFRGTCT
jgi:hypothetical protein